VKLAKSSSEAADATARRQPSRSSREAILWIGPAALVILFIFGYSVVKLFIQSFRYDGGWVGFENFSIVITDPIFLTALKHNGLLLLAVPVLVVLAFILAITLFETRRGMRFYRSAVFLPYVLPIPVVAVIFGFINCMALLIFYWNRLALIHLLKIGLAIQKLPWAPCLR
jgi:ABC-type sugar transport system permease subunit